MRNDIRELDTTEIESIAGGGRASPTRRLVIFGYGIEWNDRSICIVTPTQDTIINRPK
jgi:hypothetical protein